MIRWARPLTCAALGAAALVAAAPLAGADVDPVRLTVTAPATARTGSAVTVTIAVAADAGALDPRVGTLHVGVRLAPECGGSFPTTPGPTAISAALAPQPTAGAAYAASVHGSTVAPTSATLTVCTFLFDDEGRQFATDTDSAVVVSPTGAVNGPGTGGSGSGSGSGAGAKCVPSVTGTATVRQGRSLSLHYRACAKGSYRFSLLRLDGAKRLRGKGPHRTVAIHATGKRSTKFPVKSLAVGRYRIVMVVPSSHRHVRATRSVRVLHRRR